MVWTGSGTKAWEESRMHSYTVIFGHGRAVTFDRPSDLQHPAAVYWRSAEDLARYFECGCKGDACILDEEDRAVAIMPTISYPPVWLQL
jgi:hypothetical protein